MIEFHVVGHFLKKRGILCPQEFKINFRGQVLDLEVVATHNFHRILSYESQSLRDSSGTYLGTLQGRIPEL